jgi:hypothetical protein
MVHLNVLVLAIEIYHHWMVNDVHVREFFQHDHDHFDVCLNRYDEMNMTEMNLVEILTLF